MRSRPPGIPPGTIRPVRGIPPNTNQAARGIRPGTNRPGPDTYPPRLAVSEGAACHTMRQNRVIRIHPPATSAVRTPPLRRAMPAGRRTQLLRVMAAAPILTLRLARLHPIRRPRPAIPSPSIPSPASIANTLQARGVPSRAARARQSPLRMRSTAVASLEAPGTAKLQLGSSGNQTALGARQVESGNRSCE